MQNTPPFNHEAGDDQLSSTPEQDELTLKQEKPVPLASSQEDVPSADEDISSANRASAQPGENAAPPVP
ncbi:MAG TPA: hypothetical protein VHD63_05935, partial [Ktedonobacteraceae bacterium]|nr:hypothetical protein [Ktedonobacteraceae bacterium]